MKHEEGASADAVELVAADERSDEGGPSDVKQYWRGGCPSNWVDWADAQIAG
jgi:hypothetical protein